ncbi:hypothetical protein AMATHDRAFT_7480 [Amanita thiersii Skay4041]|uniref:Uncharacterized protein n=1 Tax=Amanita thiersii Skay4041 TaxID=703135 RepID=A0A2A9NEL7_9AGAR|nr:hypothetical protein AMATHDRAFT_7480 [Amanita thiersii Skay4041]
MRMLHIGISNAPFEVPINILMLSYSRSQILGFGLESVAYGIYVTLFVACLCVFWSRYSTGQKISWVFVVASLVLFALVTVHLAVDILRIMEAFGNTTTAEADAYYHEFQSIKSVIKTAVYTSVTWVSDALMLYRCYIVWNESWLIMTVPLLLLVADIGWMILKIFCGIFTDVLWKQWGTTVFTGPPVPVLQSFFALTLVTNGLCANLIAYKLWNTQRQIERAIPNTARTETCHFTRVWVIVLESGSVYWAALLAMLAAYIAGASGTFLIFLDLMSPIIGIVFSLIIVRASLGFKPDGSGGRTFSSLMFASQGQVQSHPATPEWPARRQSEFSPVLTVTVAAPVNLADSQGKPYESIPDWSNHRW